MAYRSTGGRYPRPPWARQRQGPRSSSNIGSSGPSYQSPSHLHPGQRYHINQRCDTDVEMTDLSREIVAPATTQNPFVNPPSTGWPFPPTGQPSDTDVVMTDVSEDASTGALISRPLKRKHGCVTAPRGESPEKKRRLVVPVGEKKQGPSTFLPGPSAPQKTQTFGGSSGTAKTHVSVSVPNVAPKQTKRTRVVKMQTGKDIKPPADTPGPSTSRRCKRPRDGATEAQDQSSTRKRRATSPKKDQQGPSVSVPGPSAPQRQQGHRGERGRSNPGANVNMHPAQRPVLDLRERINERRPPPKSSKKAAQKTRSRYQRDLQSNTTMRRQKNPR